MFFLYSYLNYELNIHPLANKKTLSYPNNFFLNFRSNWNRFAIDLNSFNVRIFAYQSNYND